MESFTQEYSTIGNSRAQDGGELLAGAGMTAADVALCSSDEARSLLPCREALLLQALPLAIRREQRGIQLHVAAASDDHTLRQKLRFICGIEVDITRVAPEVLQEAIPRAYYGSDQRLQGFLRKVSSEPQAAHPEPHDDPPTPKGDAAQFITALLEFSAVRGASDLHLSPSSSGVVVKMRVDGELLALDRNPYAKHFHEQIVSRLKVLADLDISQRKLPQDGAFSVVVGEGQQQIRMSTLPTAFGESIVLRFLRTREIPTIADLGMEPSAYQLLRSAVARSEGLILLSGPTGSGKTTTMYALAVELQQRGRGIVSVEDPVEARLAGAIQVQVAVEQGLDYPRAIRSVLRHDPDVLLIGEMRDGQSASMAVDASSTGHLTLSSLHIGSSLDVLTRLDVLGVSIARAVPALSLVVNQRLVPKLCERCKRSDEVMQSSCSAVIFQSVGCNRCAGSGYSGRVLVTEVLDLRSREAKNACYRASNAQHLLELLPHGAFIPFTEALQFQLYRGALSLAQVEEFVFSEMR